MINLFRFLLRNSSFFLFIVFEIIAIYLVVNYNTTQRTIFINSSNKVSGLLLEKYDEVRDYFNLANINQSLSEENALLLQKIEKLKLENPGSTNIPFGYKEAKVLSNTLDGRYNRFLINRGNSSGVEKGMGVLYNNQPVGIIYQVSQRHASVISLLNVNLNLSTSVKDKEYFGTLTWFPPNPREAILNHVPAYADVLLGDTLVTSGYSQIFPPGLHVGKVTQVTTPKGSNLHEIYVELFADFGRINYVQIVENLNRTELDSLTLESDI